MQSQPKPMYMKLAVVCFLLVGICFLIAGITISIRTFLFVQAATKTTGIITSFVHDSDGDCFPVFQFQDASQYTHAVQSNVSNGLSELKVGDKVEVLYSQSDPTRAEINDFARLYFLPMVLVFMGGVFFSGLIARKVRSLFLPQSQTSPPTTN